MNKILRTLYLVPLSFILTGCWTSIFTVAPTVEPVAPPKTVYTTQVTTPSPKVTTVTTVTVTNYNDDLSFYLDLNAVAAAFAESRSVEEFERLLNSSRYMINNLDLNRDGWIDYLRVIETHRGYYHTLLIQACLAPSVFQDVATLIAEYRPNALYVEVVGDRWLYGPNYVVRPVFIKRPVMWDVYGHPTYVVWRSPYYYGYFPSYYVQPKPVYLYHYQAYVTTYMSNHHYCHHCDYLNQPFYSNYTEMTHTDSRNDYRNAHPNDSFERRVKGATSTGGVSVRNAGDLRNEVSRQQAEKDKETTSSRSTSGTSSRSDKTTTASSTGGSSARSTGSGSSTPSRQGSTSTSSSSSSSSSSGRSGSTATTSTGGSSARSTGSSSSTPSRQSTTKTTESTPRPQTTVESRVNRSGTTRTTVTTVDASGRTTSVKRESSAPRQSSQTNTRSTSSSSSSRSGSTSGTTSTGGSSSRSTNTRR